MEKYKCKKCNIVKDLTLEYFIKTSIKNIKNEIKTGNPYCKICQNQCTKTENNKPMYGDIRERRDQWSEKLTWKPKNHSKEAPFIEVVEKLQIDFEKIKKEIKKLGWRDIPECHLKQETKKNKRRKKQYHLCSSDEE